MNLGVLISGRGSNLGAIIDAIGAGRLSARVRLVISNKANAAGLTRAKDAGMLTRVISHADYPDRNAFDGAIVESLVEAGVDWVVLAGFMRILSPVVLEAFPNRIINIHPSLLPAFPGIDATGQAIQYGARVSGCTVHLVDAGTDTGPILAQAAVPIVDGDTRDTLAARILTWEHELLVKTLAGIGGGSIEIISTGHGKRPVVRVRELRATSAFVIPGGDPG